MKEQDKYPQTWEKAKQLSHTVQINPSSLIGLRRSFVTDYDKAAKLMAERYEARIAELENQWIPVEERLPEEKDADENGKVLIYRVTNNSQASLSKSIYDWAMVKYLEKDSHWMPLPNKPPHK